jgi:hypothetical protein
LGVRPSLVELKRCVARDVTILTSRMLQNSLYDREVFESILPGLGARLPGCQDPA